MRSSSEDTRLMAGWRAIRWASRQLPGVHHCAGIEVDHAGRRVALSAEGNGKVSAAGCFGSGHHIAGRHDRTHEKGKEREGSQLFPQAAHDGKYVCLPWLKLSRDEGRMASRSAYGGVHFLAMSPAACGRGRVDPE